MKIKKIIFILYASFIFIFQIQNLIALDVITIIKINDKTITTIDLEREKLLLKYIYNNKINDQSLNKLAVNNLIEQYVKEIEVNKENMLLAENESFTYFKTVLENNNKSLEVFRKEINNQTIEKHFIKKIQIEMSWNRLILKKFSHLININMDEILAKKRDVEIKNDEINLDIIKEKNKKLKSLSETYFNEIKSKTLIKYL